MPPHDRKGQQVKVGDVVTMTGRVARAPDHNSVCVKIDDTLSVYVPPAALEVLK